MRRRERPSASMGVRYLLDQLRLAYEADKWRLLARQPDGRISEFNTRTVSGYLAWEKTVMGRGRPDLGDMGSSAFRVEKQPSTKKPGPKKKLSKATSGGRKKGRTRNR